MLRQTVSLFREGLAGVPDLSSHVAVTARRLAAASLGANQPLTALCMRFFNSYLRAALTARGLSAAYYVMHQYRIFAESCIASGAHRSAEEIAEHMRHYGQLAFEISQPFLLEVTAYDLALLVERAVPEDAALVDRLLDLLLRVDRASADHEAQEESLRGVRRAQIQLAAFFLTTGDEVRARRIHADMAHERIERLLAVRAELEGETEPLYREFTDRGLNFSYLPPDRRALLATFFSWFSTPGMRPPAAS